MEKKPLSYQSLHLRVYRAKGKATKYKCVDCKEPAQQWSNIDHKYSENVDDYKPRCTKCHKKYDYQLTKNRKEGEIMKKILRVFFPDSELHLKFKILCAENGISMNSQILKLVEGAVKKTANRKK